MCIESVRIPTAQLALLQPYQVQDVLERYNLARYVAENLFYRSLLSFDPNEVRFLTPAQETELNFLCGVTRHVGLRGIDGVLAGLRAPYAFPLSEVLYDFVSGAWVVRADLKEERADHAA